MRLEMLREVAKNQDKDSYKEAEVDEVEPGEVVAEAVQLLPEAVTGRAELLHREAQDHPAINQVENQTKINKNLLRLTPENHSKTGNTRIYGHLHRETAGYKVVSTLKLKLKPAEASHHGPIHREKDCENEVVAKTSEKKP